MSSKAAIHAEGLGKCYQLYTNPKDRLKQFLWRGKRQYYREFWALHDVSFDVMPGEVVGIIGRNGSGKSTLLQLVCGTLTPTHGEVKVNGRIAALLELGAGFNPEFTGRENVFMSAAIMGLSQEEITARYEDIVEFSGIRDFIDQPVKTYSSGMYVRLAFSVAISVDPDILVIDEALSVGDGEFSRRSFDRIMALKEQNKTILFCSHSLYQVEALCNRVVWLNQGGIAAEGRPAEVVIAYDAFLSGNHHDEARAPQAGMPPQVQGTARITRVEASADGERGKLLQIDSGRGNLVVNVAFSSDPSLPAPSVAICITGQDGRIVTSAGTQNDGLTLARDASGDGGASLHFDSLPLLKGGYDIHAYLMCERAIHVYDVANMVAELNVTQRSLELGVVSIPHRWCDIEPTPTKARLAERVDAALVKVHERYLMELDSLDSLGLAHDNGVFEAEEARLCRLLLNEGDRVLDIGANIGYFTLLFGGLVSPAGSVFAIEPDATNYHLLQKNIANNLAPGLVDARQIALGSQAGSARLYLSDSNNGMHRLYPSVCCTDDSTEVLVVTGDSLKLAPLDLIKIDIEGYEPAALQGLSSTLANSPNLKILCGFSPLSIWEAGFSPIQFLHEMQKYKFCLFCNESDGWRETSFESILAELEKIPATMVASFIQDFEQEKNTKAILRQASNFLIQHGYSRPTLENILFVAPGAMEQVSRLIRT